MLPEHELPSSHQVVASLSACLHLPADALTVQEIAELAPGLSAARLFRVHLRGRVPIELLNPRLYAPGESPPCSFILKVPDWGRHTLIAPQDPQLASREVEFYESGLAVRLPERLRAPALVGVDRSGPQTWLWMEDVGRALNVAWEPAHALLAAKRNALLHRLYLGERAALERLPWLERQGYAAHGNYVPSAHQHLDQLAQHAQWSRLFTAEERTALHRALDLADWAAAEMAHLPHTLIHGDFHIANLGFDVTGVLVAIDWAHVGIAPIGCDAATLISLYTGMGGRGALPPGAALEHEIVAAYCDQLAHETGQAPAAVGKAVERACGLWHLTWGLHLRLGPGLDWLLRRPDQDSADATSEAASIRDGCRRALAFLQRR